MKQPPDRPLQSAAEALHAFRMYDECRDACEGAKTLAALCPANSASKAKALERADQHARAAAAWRGLLADWLSLLAQAEGKGFL